MKYLPVIFLSFLFLFTFHKLQKAKEKQAEFESQLISERAKSSRKVDDVVIVFVFRDSVLQTPVIGISGDFVRVQTDIVYLKKGEVFSLEKSKAWMNVLKNKNI